MYKRLSIISFIFFFSVSAFSQTGLRLMEDSIFQQDLKRFNESFLNQSIKKDKKLKKRQDLEFYHIFVFQYVKDSLSKEQVEDLSFLSDLEPMYCWDKPDCLFTFPSFLVDSAENILAELSCNNLYVTSKKMQGWGDPKLIDLMKNGGFDCIFIFTIGKSIPLNQYLGIKNKELYGIVMTLEGYKVYNNEQLIKDHWYDFFEDIFKWY